MKKLVLMTLVLCLFSPVLFATDSGKADPGPSLFSTAGVFTHRAPGSLTTIFAQNNGFAGNFFDIEPKTSLSEVTALDVNHTVAGELLSVVAEEVAGALRPDRRGVEVDRFLDRRRPESILSQESAPVLVRSRQGTDRHLAAFARQPWRGRPPGAAIQQAARSCGVEIVNPQVMSRVEQANAQVGSDDAASDEADEHEVSPSGKRLSS